MDRLRRMMFALCLVATAAAAWAAAGLAAEPDGRFDRLDRLQVLGDAYPRAFFFRASEGAAARRGADYDEWDATFSRLMGIQGKALDEEVPGRGLRNPDFFTRFKQAHPEQLVLLHYNGNARDPRFDGGPFFAGHWLYYEGATVLSEVPAEAGPTEIRVSDPSRFHTSMGRYRSSNDDIGLCVLDAAGRLDWHASEQARLVSVDRERGVITVERGCYGTEPRAFAAGKAYAAPHATEGPWGQRSHLMWFYNYSTHCPKDEGGRTCADVHADELADRFAPGGQLAAFDGVEFDVLFHTRARQADCDADGKPDGGMFDGVNTYGLGVTRFLERLRERLGEDRLITADGHHDTHQRGFGVANGIESEGWPALNDREVTDWSGGLNRHDFWAVRGRAPIFNYINHKFTEPTGDPGRPEMRPDVPWPIHRLVLAAAVMTNSAVCYSYAPPPEKGETFGVWDELWMGTAHRLAYLGRPAGPARHLAGEAPDALGGAAAPPGEALLKRLSGNGLRFALDAGAVKVTADDASASEIVFRLRGVPCDGPDLVVRATLRAAPLPGYPEAMARLAHVGIAKPEGELVTAPVRYMTWADGQAFTSHAYFSDVRSKTVDLEFVFEGTSPVWIGPVTAHAAPDAMVRVFEHGVVLANPSPRPQTFDLSRLAPGRSLRRIRGSSRQDPQTNSGAPVGTTVTLGLKDALFLVDAEARDQM